MNNFPPVSVGPYQLVPLDRIRCDDLAAFLGPSPGIYVCNAPTEGWYRKFGIKETQPNTISKKRAVFASLAQGSQWLSPTYVEGGNATDDWQEGDVQHIGHGFFRGRLAQLFQTVRLFQLLFKRLDHYEYMVVYNLPLPTTLAPLAVRALFGKKLVVDFEDDYTLQRSSRFKNCVDRSLRSFVDGAICVNASMQRFFAGRRTCVVNAFAEVVRFPEKVFADGARFLVSGSLDHIRGADLIPDLVTSLRSHLSAFRIDVTGDGPLRSLITSMQEPEVTYHGLVSDGDYSDLLAASDICVVLQRPDHPFSQGSYPSKIQAYARQHKPVMVLRQPGCDPPW
jgi:hypothetical protein